MVVYVSNLNVRVEPGSCLPSAPTDPGEQISRTRFLSVTVSRHSPLSVVVALTRSSVPIHRRVSQQRLRNPAAPFPTRRLSSGWISLLSTGTMRPLSLLMALPAPLPLAERYLGLPRRPSALPTSEGTPVRLCPALRPRPYRTRQAV